MRLISNTEGRNKMYVNYRVEDIDVFESCLELRSDDKWFLAASYFLSGDKFNINGFKFDVAIDSGACYDRDTYSLPSNTLCLNKEFTNKFLYKLYNNYDARTDCFEDVDNLLFLGCSCGVYTEDDLFTVYTYLIELIEDCQRIHYQSLHEAVEAEKGLV